MLLIGKHVVLIRQIGTAGIHKIDTWQVVLLRDILSPKMLFYRNWVIGAAFDRRIVSDNDTLLAHNPTNPCNQARRGHIILPVHIECCEL